MDFIGQNLRRIMDKYRVKRLISKKAIEQRIEEIASEIERDYKGKNPIIAVVLKGGVIFASDLLRKVNIPFMLDFIGAASYNGTTSSGDIKITKDLDTPIIRRHLILVEDIVDTGLTLFKLCKLLRQREPLSIKIATLLEKEISRPFELRIDYVGFKIPNKFVVGYGLDYNERHRGLPFIGYIEWEEEKK